MSAITAILPRLDAGRPLILSGDPAATLASRGVGTADLLGLGRLVREQPAVVAAHYELDIAAGVDVLSALTSETTPRALGAIGMAFRSAALTAAAVDLAQDATSRASRAVAVAGLLGSRQQPPDGPSGQLERLAEEYAMHAARLAAAGCEILIARGAQGSAARLVQRAAIVSAAATHLPTWAVIEVTGEPDHPCMADGESIEACARAAVKAGAQVLLFEVTSADLGLAAFERAAASADGACFGALLAASAGSSPGTPDEGLALAPWAADAKRLVDAGARVIGGGAGATAHHTTALASALGRAKRASIWPRAL